MAPKHPKRPVKHRTGSKAYDAARWKTTHQPIVRGKPKRRSMATWERDLEEEKRERVSWARTREMKREYTRKLPAYAQDREWVRTYLPNVKSDNPDYLHRLARSIIKSLNAGQEPKRQAARGHRTTREHPRQFYVSRAGGSYAQRPSHGTAQAPGDALQQREYRDPAALVRWVFTRLPAGVWFQVISRGELLPEYSTIGEAEGDEADDEGHAPRAWRTVYTGPDGAEDQNGVTLYSVADLHAAEARIFVRGSVDLRILRW